MKSEERDVRLFLDDIVQSVSLIQEYLQGVTEEEFHRSQAAQDAVVRRIEIIGEATKHIPNELRNKYPEVTWRMMAGMIDIIAHEYFAINYNRVWDTAINFIPPLKEQVETIIKELSTSE